MLVNVVIGTATIPVIWWIGRSWFGPVAGIGAATLLALNEFHIALSRTALADVAFALFFLIALFAIVSAIERDSISISVIAGLLVGLAWNTKYHGWFALVVILGALVPYLWFRHQHRLPIRRIFLLWTIMSAVAFLCYLPWVLYIEAQPGGYADLARYQRTSLSRAWLDNLIRQFEHQSYLDGVFSRIAFPMALLATTVVGKFRQTLRMNQWLLLAISFIPPLLIGSYGTIVLFTLISLLFLVRADTRLSGWVLLAWIGLWVVTLPLYDPYARLLLPVLLAMCLAAGIVYSSLLQRDAVQLNDFSSIGIAPLTAAVAMIVIAFATTYIPDSSSPWRSEQTIVEAAQEMGAILNPGDRVIVIGEPTVAFYLHQQGFQAFERMDDPAQLAQVSTPVYVVTGIYTDRAPQLRNGLAELDTRLTPLGTYAIDPGDIRLLDDHIPEKARAYRDSPDNRYELSLYLLSS